MNKLYYPVLVETGNKFGNMNRFHFDKQRQYNEQERRQMFLEARIKAARVYGFDPYKMFVPTQGKGKTYEVLTQEMIDSVQDGWDLEIPADILMIRFDTPQVVVGYPVADCAVVVAADLKNGITATAHCSGKMVDQMLPKITLESLKEEADSKDEDIFVYVSACIGQNWTYSEYPSWISNHSFWEECKALKEEKGLYKIDLRKAILAQLETSKYKKVFIHPSDTQTDPNFYSNNASSHGNVKKYGRHFAGAFYPK